MAQNYTRQSSFADGDTITASLFNNEYNQLVNAFAYSSTDISATGHRHDGSIGQGGNIAQIGDLDFNNKIVVDGTNNRWGFFVEVAGASVEQIRLQDGAIIPVTTNDIDLGSASLQFKDAYFDGTVNADSLVLSSGATVTAVLDEDAMTSNSATALATQQSIKAYVDSQVTAQDLDFQGDSGGALSIDLDSEILTIAGGTGIDTSGAINTLTVSIDSTVTTLTGTQTLTNKTLTSPDINGGTIDGAIVGATTAAAGSFTTVVASGNITVGGTVDGRDVAADGTKLDGIEAGATADQTAAEIRALVEAATDSNVFTDADHTKLNGIEALADVTDTANVTAAGALMDSELTNITAVKALNQGVSTTDSPTFAGATLTTADINGGTIDGTVIGATTPAAGSFTTISASGEIAANGGVAFGDNDKATFGASDDLQIYHDGSNTRITEAGTGSLLISADDLFLRNVAGNSYFQGISGGSSNIFHAGSVKLATTATGIDVTGTVTADGLTVTAGTASGTLASLKGNTGFGFTFSSSATAPYVQSLGVGGGEELAITSGGTTIALFQDGGDFQLYEDTGTTAKFYWDASAESLGIGTTSPVSYDSVARNLVLARASDAGMTIASGTASAGNLVFADGTIGVDAYRGILKYDHASDAMSFFTNGVRNMTIDSSGNVGIGTTSPSNALDVQGDSDVSIRVRSTSTGASDDALVRIQVGGTTARSFLWFGDADSSSVGQIAYQHSNDSMQFYTNATERARIDSSGNLLVGKTSAGTIGTEGIEIRADDSVYVTRNGNPLAYFNRLTSDGDIVRFQKNSTTVGSIGTKNGIQYIAGANKGLRFDSTQLIPTDSTGTNSDASFDLGNSGVRFKDIYLSGNIQMGNGYNLTWGGTYAGNYPTIAATTSGGGSITFYPNGAGTGADVVRIANGGVYLGGTGAANKLDDYETGTWTPTLAVNNFTVTPTTLVGTYVKVGKNVTVTLRLYAGGTAIDQTAYCQISGLPFSCASSTQGGAKGTTNTVAAWFDASVVATSVFINNMTSGGATNWFATITYTVA